MHFARSIHTAASLPRGGHGRILLLSGRRGQGPPVGEVAAIPRAAALLQPYAFGFPRVIYEPHALRPAARARHDGPFLRRGVDGLPARSTAALGGLPCGLPCGLRQPDRIGRAGLTQALCVRCRMRQPRASRPHRCLRTQCRAPPSSGQRLAAARLGMCR